MLNITRYETNRKLYLNGRYINLDNIEDFTRTNLKFKITGHKSKQDLTSAVQSQIIRKMYHEKGPKETSEYLKILENQISE